MSGTDDHHPDQQAQTDESRSVTSTVTAPEAVDDDRVMLSDKVVEDSSPFVGRWNELVSTTNWEKGRLIGEWRDEWSTNRRKNKSPQR